MLIKLFIRNINVKISLITSNKPKLNIIKLDKFNMQYKQYSKL